MTPTKNPITGSRVLSVPCPRCGQPAQAACRRPRDNRTTDPCDARTRLWNEQRRGATLNTQPIP